MHARIKGGTLCVLAKIDFERSNPKSSESSSFVFYIYFVVHTCRPRDCSPCGAYNIVFLKTTFHGNAFDACYEGGVTHFCLGFRTVGG